VFLQRHIQSTKCKHDKQGKFQSLRYNRDETGGLPSIEINWRQKPEGIPAEFLCLELHQRYLNSHGKTELINHKYEIPLIQQQSHSMPGREFSRLIDFYQLITQTIFHNG
jgi:hypothetical protein